MSGCGRAPTGTGGRVGWLWVRPLDDAAIRAAFLYQMTLAQSLRGRGHGRAMLTALEDLLAAQGVEELRLNVFERNVPARRLYAAAGYEQVGATGPRRNLRKRLLPSRIED